jgi:hypothetical protein
VRQLLYAPASSMGIFPCRINWPDVMADLSLTSFKLKVIKFGAKLFTKGCHVPFQTAERCDEDANEEILRLITETGRSDV